MIRRLILIARSILTEAVRRREIYGLVLATVILLGWASTFRFFDMQGLHKFYQEMALRGMSIATMISVIVLASIQLPREFKNRTIYTVLAKPVGRFEFVLGKYLGVVAAGVFCLALFIGVFVVCNLVMKFEMRYATFAQYVYLQFLLVTLVAGLAFALSLVFNQDAAITMTALIFLLGQIFTSAITILYDLTTPAGRVALKVINYTVPQPALYDMSGKVVHGYPPIETRILLLITAYTAGFVIVSLALSYLFFRRRPL